jgi:pyruvate kinase
MKNIAGIRMNTAMVDIDSLDNEFQLATKIPNSVPLWFDIKGRQLRVTDVFEYPDHLELEINHPIMVDIPTPVLFKAGSDHCLLKQLKGNRRLIFEGGPNFRVRVGESLHIRDNSLQVYGSTFTDFEKKKIIKALRAGIRKYYLSYVECQKDVDEFRELVGKEAEVILKIESKKGLEYTRKFKKKDNLTLMAARGDLYVEVDKPHDIIAGLKTIIEADPEAMVGSRIFLSVVKDEVPECCDFLELAWLYEHGYRKFLLCDEICLKENLILAAVGAFEAFKTTL